ncbi:uncharacterized protein [Amphiura filiformis]|uniref:uncharacterized protein n=1 Tax=Amphiura filiformis TaxID=82378 RepID=UPI003B2163F9
MLRGFLLAAFAVVFAVYVEGHGRLWEPAGRGTEWRKGFWVPEPQRDYNDDQVYCGGRGVQWDMNDGKCGVCGDDWRQAEPREHEDGGKYHAGYIVQTYTQGSLIDVQLELTTNHLGWFEFRLCARAKASEPLTFDCLNQHLLTNHKGETRVNIGKAGGFLDFKLQLPAGVKCEACVLQWKYATGNDWGICPNGTGMVGCHPEPEEFYACSDIAIV